MEKYRAIPQGYMTVGEIAKKMGVTVRTLQHYDREGLFSPSSLSEGGRRLYADKDIIKLHQILSLKSIGFSLEDIKKRLPSLDTPADVADILTEQAAAIREKLESLSKSLTEIEALRVEVLQMQSVDFKKYADIIVNLQMRNEFYWLIKYFDDQTLDHIRSRFDKEDSLRLMNTFSRLSDEAIQLQKDSVPPDSEKGQSLAKRFWAMVMEFTGGDMNMLPKLIEMGNFKDAENEDEQKQALVNAYIELALDAYFTKLGINPIQEEPK